MNESPLLLSVIIPTYRRPHLLERCLTALTSQSLDPELFEVVVCDDGGVSQSGLVCSNVAKKSGVLIRYLPLDKHHGPAAARNVGWRNARGTYIAFTDDDCVPDPNWLSEIASLVSLGAEAGRGKIVVPLPPVPTDYEKNEAGLARAHFVTANCFCSRALLERVGGFDERFTSAWREDSDLEFKLIDLGVSIVYLPTAVVVHPVRPARWGVSLYQQRKAMFNALLYKKHPRLYRIKIEAGPPTFYYCSVVLLGLCAALLTVGRPVWAQLAGLAWLMLTLYFAARRLRGTSRAPLHIAEMLFTSALIPPLSIYWRVRGSVRYRTPFL